MSDALEQSILRHEGYLRSDAGNVTLRLALGDLYHQAGRLEDAVACFERCLIDVPGHVAARSRLASVRITQHRFADAERMLRELIEPGLPNAALLHNLGLSLYFQERWDEARQCFADAAALGLAAPANCAYLARSLHHLGAIPEAIAACEQWVQIAPQDTAGQSFLALLHMDNGDPQAAQRVAAQTLEQNPQALEANIVAGVLATENQQTAQARAHFETVLRQDRHNGRAWLGLGLIHLYNGDHALAIEAMHNAVRIYPNNPGTIVALGWAQISARDPAAAQRTFEQAVQADRNFAESHGGLAAALALQQQLEPARAEIKLARGLDPNGFGAEFARATILAVEGRQDMAGNVMTRILQSAPREGMLPLVEHLRLYTSRRPGAPGGAPAGGSGGTATRH